MNKTIYIADNQTVSDEVNSDLEFIKTNTQVKPAPETPVDTVPVNNTGWMIIVLIVIFLLIAVFIGLFLNLKNQTDVRMSGILSKKSGNKKNNSAVINVKDIEKEQQQSKNNEKIEELNSEFQTFIPEKDIISGDDDNDNDNSLKLGTPRSIENCIKNFLEITKGSF